VTVTGTHCVLPRLFHYYHFPVVHICVHQHLPTCIPELLLDARVHIVGHFLDTDLIAAWLGGGHYLSCICSPPANIVIYIGIIVFGTSSLLESLSMSLLFVIRVATGSYAVIAVIRRRALNVNGHLIRIAPPTPTRTC
jgi:hypothetical protein